MTIEQLIKEKIKAELNPTSIKLINESYKHAGHSGDNGTGQTHFKLRVVCGDFAGLSKIDRQRKVLSILNPLFTMGLHAISMDLQDRDTKK